MLKKSSNYKIIINVKMFLKVTYYLKHIYIVLHTLNVTVKEVVKKKSMILHKNILSLILIFLLSNKNLVFTRPNQKNLFSLQTCF